jgi:hypothetical protein
VHGPDRPEAKEVLMPFPRSLTRAAVLACAVLFALPAFAFANGDTLCVGRGGADCDFAENLDMEAAIDIANNDAQKDTISVGAGTFTPANGQVKFTFDSLVDVVGAGSGSTTLQAPDPTNSGSAWTAYLVTTGSTIKDVKILQNDAAFYGLVLNSSTAERVVVVASDSRPVNNGKGVLFNSGASTLRNSTVTVPTGSGVGTHNDWAIWNAGTGPNTVDKVTATGDNAIVSNGGTTNVTSSTLTGHRVFVLNGSGTADIKDSVIRATVGSTTTAIGLWSQSNGSGISNLTTHAVTVVGGGLAGSQGVNVGVSACSNGTATATLNGTTVSGFAQDSIQDNPACVVAASCCPTTCPAATANQANLQWNFSHGEKNNSQLNDGCLGFNGFKTGSPGFVSSTSDLRPRQPSPLIDSGETTADAGGEVDFRGAPRVVDGDNSAGPRRDIGAYEYQRNAPTVTAAVTPATGPISQVFGFSASGQDADGEALNFIWTFDDGAFATSANIDHSFGALGPHSGEVQVIDPSGLSAKASAAVTVANPPPAATPTPVPTPVPDKTAPKVTVSGGSLTADKKGNVKLTIGCPATESAPCAISLVASSKKKIALKKGKKKKITSLGKGSGSVPNGKSATVTLKLTKSVLSYIKKKKKLPARFSVTAKDVAGNTNSVTVNITIKAPKK